MAFSWSKQQQIAYFLIVFVTIVFIAIYAYYLFFKPAPTCFDGVKNQGELGVDCGGSCAALCKSQIGDLIVLWSRSLQVRPGMYDAVAYVENPNPEAGIRTIGYMFSLYDAQGAKIGEARGATYVNANENFAVFAPGIDTHGKVPARTFFEFDKHPAWLISPQIRQGDLAVKNQQIIGQDAEPRLVATVRNDTVRSFRDLEVIALIYDIAGNIVGASRTYIDRLPKRSQEQVTFTWPRTYKERPEFCTAPVDVMLVIDRSGSMGFENKKAPYVYSSSANNQPFETAKKAAQLFVDNMKVGDQIGVASFSNDGTVDRLLTSSFDQAKAGIAGITILGANIYAQNTNIASGITAALKELSSPRRNANAKRAIVLLTDGVADLPKDPVHPRDPTDAFAKAAAAAAASTTKEQNIIVYAIGLGKDVDTDLLQNKVATDPEHYYAATDHSGSQLGTIYKQIAATVCKEENYTATIFIRNNEVP